MKILRMGLTRIRGVCIVQTSQAWYIAHRQCIACHDEI